MKIFRQSESFDVLSVTVDVQFLPTVAINNNMVSATQFIHFYISMKYKN